MRLAQPIELAQFKGAPVKNPQRYRKSIPKSPLEMGQAPDYLTEPAKKVWFEIAAYAIPGVLTGADRIIVETLCELLSEFRMNPREFPCNKLTQMIGCLGRLGMTPSDRNKLGVDKKPEGESFDDF